MKITLKSRIGKINFRVKKTPSYISSILVQNTSKFYQVYKRDKRYVYLKSL